MCFVLKNEVMLCDGTLRCVTLFYVMRCDVIRYIVSRYVTGSIPFELQFGFK